MTDLLRRAYDAREFRSQGHALIDRLANYLERVENQPANPFATPEDSLAHFRELLGGAAGEKEPPTTEQLFDAVINRSVHLHHPAYLGHQIVPPAPLAALGDVAASLLNTGMAVFEMGRPGTAMERVVIEQFAQMLELAPTAGGFLTSGGTLANLTGLLAARAHKLGQHDTPLTKPCLLVNAQAHYCIDRAAHIMGWGKEGIIHVPYDGEMRMRTALIDGLVEQAEARGLMPVAIVGSACTTSTGSYDDLSAIADAAQRHGLWFHVDGAHGGAIRLDPKRKHRAAGLERADSFTMDFHKMLLTPALTTALFFREDRAAYRTFQQRADYLLSNSRDEREWFNVAKRSFECTKRMLSLRVYSLLYAYGPELFRDYVVRVGDLGAELASMVRKKADLELLMEPDVNIVCFRFRPFGRAVGSSALDELNAMIRSDLTTDGAIYLVQTVVNGTTYLRCTIANAFTQTQTLGEMLERIVDTGIRLLEVRQGLGR